MEDLALVILNYNTAEDTVKNVKQLSSFGAAFHVVVVDNQSTDDSYHRIKEEVGNLPNVDILFSPENRGYSAGNNMGMKYAIETYHVKYVGILNPDVWIPDVCVLENMQRSLEIHENIAVIGASMIDIDGNYNPNASAWNIPTKKEVIWNHFLMNNRRSRSCYFKIFGNRLAQVECVAGCFFLARASVMEELGYLDENVFLYNEENILGIRCRQKGYIEAVALDQFYYHNHDYDNEKKERLRDIIASRKGGYRSRQYLCRQYYSSILLPLLWFVEKMNHVYLVLCCVKRLMRKYIRWT